MIPFRTEITVNRPVDQVFRFVSDPSSYPKWMTGVTYSALVSGKPVRVGAQVRLKGRAGPWSYDGPMEITEYEPSRRFSFKASIPGTMEFKGTWLFEPEGDATHLRADGEYRLQGLWRLAEPLLAGEAKKGEADELKKIKSIMEEDSPSPQLAKDALNR